jgi:hypothetical protein
MSVEFGRAEGNGAMPRTQALKVAKPGAHRRER